MLITIDEAYRFLLNRLLEKQMQAKKKQDSNINEGIQDEGHSSSASGLLSKKRLNNKVGKKNKAVK